MLPIAKDLTTVSAMMFSSVQGMKFFITFEAILYFFVKNPLLLWAKRCFDNFSDLFIHAYKWQYN
jgi:hypothetical protein